MSVDLLSDEDKQTLRSHAHDFWAKVEKRRQGERFFTPGHANLKQFQQEAYESLRKMFDFADEVPMRINAFDFFVASKSIYHNDDPAESIAYKFYQDGVKMLRFHQDINEKEFADFMTVVMADFSQAEYFGQDTVSLMWEYDFTAVSYIAVETFSTNEDADEEGGGGAIDDDSDSGGAAGGAQELAMMAQIDSMVASVMDESGAADASSAVGIRISMEDLQLLSKGVTAMDGISLADGAPGSGEKKEIISAEDVDALRQEISGEEKVLGVRYLELLLETALLAEDEDVHRRFMGRAKDAVLDLLSQGRFAAIAKVFGTAAISAKQGGDERAKLRLKEALSIVSSGDALRAYREGATRLGAMPQSSLINLIKVVPPQSSGQLLAEFLQIQDAEIRRAWVSVVLQLPNFRANQCLDLVASLSKPLAAEVIKAMGLLQNAKHESLLTEFMQHHDADIRVAALEATKHSANPDLSAVRRSLLTDSVGEVRSRALRYIQSSRDKGAKDMLLERMTDEVITKNVDEAIRFGVAYAAIFGKEAIDWIDEMLSDRKGLIRKKHEHHQLLAIEMLGIILQKDALERLQSMAANRRMTKKVRKAADDTIVKFRERAARRQAKAKAAAARKSKQASA